MNPPLVSIVGRPNVGKSSLFNRILKARHAVIEEREGTTRDRVEKFVTAGDRDFILADTGGFLPDEKDSMSRMIKTQIEKAVSTSDLLLFVCDGEKGVSPLDIELASLLRKSGKRIMLAVNKIDNEKRKESILDFYELGLGEPLPISCLHNLGITRLIGEVAKTMPEEHFSEGEKLARAIKIAIVGKPNVGKSSFLNRVLDEERVIVHEKPGTTRDAVDSFFEKDGLLFLLMDTAGIRHKRKVKEAVDIYSIMRSKDSIRRSDVALLLIDGMEGVTSDDIKIFRYILDEGKGCVIIVNKWDLVKNVEMQRYRKAIIRRAPEARAFPIEFISAKTGRNVLESFNRVKAIKTDLDLFIDAETLKEFLEDIGIDGPCHMVQTRMSPKEFVIFTKKRRVMDFLDTHYVENRLRERFPLNGIPIKITVKRPGRKK